MSDENNELRIDHIGVAVPDLETARRRYRDLLGIEPSEIETVSSESVRVSFFRLGDSRIELLKPTGEDGPVRRFLDNGRGGVRHVALRVEGSPLSKALARLERGGFPLIGDGVRKGSGDSHVKFVHPHSKSARSSSW